MSLVLLRTAKVELDRVLLGTLRVWHCARMVEVLTLTNLPSEKLRCATRPTEMAHLIIAYFSITYVRIYNHY